PSPRLASSSAAITWSRPRISTRPSSSQPASPRPSSARSRCGRSGSSPKPRGARGSSMSASAIEPVFRNEAGRVPAALGRFLAPLLRLVGDFELAEEGLQDAFAAAVEQWPAAGIPANPRAWLVNVGRHKAIDRLRRQVLHRSKRGELEAEAAVAAQVAPL